ncbi:rhomboid family intramembrane serine protease [Paracoccus sp. R12_1]|uniref:rhomboid family intramembrane serine protease n=1 Tax=unclassified Paracoccus (in: a-proteobacteria) TaxID=2688777 RepID=UPI001AD97020|nr:MULTISPECIES: rhomboid family intramembrane serine protease [unclassified Paracoccus (in: a-proteobacteria)]MBO9453770.1 rhomboid family intramembrane serine protease [Paracoccus sp. R12_2]MBO9486806.1 rhomboid family intramembrane serine protease [Paracoccus sp. R12_1]
MFPIRDHNPSQRTPIVTWAIIALNIVMFVLTLPGSDAGAALWVRLALYPLAIMHGEYLWGLASHMFLHAGLLHLGGNMLFLWIFGDNLEEQMGRPGFLLFYLATGLAAAAAQIAADPGSSVPMVGASGAIAGVMGGYLLMFPRARVDVVAIFIIFFKVFTVPAWLMLGAWLGLQLFGGFTVTGDQGGVAYWAHAGGFIAGVALCVPLFLRRGGPRFWQVTHGHPPHPEATYTQTRIPRVTR